MPAKHAKHTKKEEFLSRISREGFLMKAVSASLRLCGVILLLATTPLLAQTRDYARWVNPFIGTGGHGHTFPGATMPFGMVQLSPDTRIDNWDGSSGYHYSDNVIFGFSHTHLSGTGIPDGCDILFMPTVGEREFFPGPGGKEENGFASTFSHSNEKAEPGYYSVKLDEGNILAELTATQRVGLHRYTFPANAERAKVIVDLRHRDKVLDSELRVVGKNRIEGFRRSSSWAKNQKIYFVAEFSQDFKEYGLSGQGGPVPQVYGHIKASKLFGNFYFDPLKPVLIKVAISHVSVEGARKNLQAELPGWNFDKVRADANAAWNKELSKIEVSGGTDEQTTNFYTALYHTMIHPNIFNDVDGRYKGHDGKIYVLSPGFSRLNAAKKPPKGGTHNASEHYTVFSLWDTFRAAHPLYTIIDQKRSVDFINTFIRQYEQGGRLPVWELWGEETDTMIGYHAVSVIADAMAKEIEGFDYENAYAAAKHSAELDHFGLAAYKKRGYISMEDENESVSKTLEYAYNDFCIATMAQSLMRENLKDRSKAGREKHDRLEKEAEKYFDRSLYYRNLFDPRVGFMRPKRNGGFIEPFEPTEVSFHFTEGNSWQYSFFAPHDVAGLVELQGGGARFARKLDELFTTQQKLTGREQPDITGLIGQYAHGNEPSHHMAFLYNYASQPWKTQMYSRRILDAFYKNAPDGLIGNEDCGQMSAWYVLAALGFYQVNPSHPVYDIASPIFRSAKINLENGRSFTITAPNTSPANNYIRSLKLNGKEHSSTQFRHSDLMAGGTLAFEMSPTPVTNWFMEFSYSPGGGSHVTVPIIEAAGRTFHGSTEVKIIQISPDSKILYSSDGGEPRKEYTAPFTIDQSTTIKAVAVDHRGRRSFPVEAVFIKRPNNWTVKIDHRYNRQYTGGGDEGLIDGIRGTVNFASGEWQGYQPHDVVATIDLKKPTEIKRLGGGFLQEARSWIWMPTRIEFEVSSDGVNFTRIAEIKTDVAVDDMKPQIRDHVQAISPVTARYVRVRAYNLGKIPAWHPGAGNDAFIFVDEILIN